MKRNKDLIYISGPMSSVQREQYIARFRLAEQLLRRQGYTHIVNPVRVWTCRFPWLFRIIGYRLTLFYDLWLLTRCNRIYKMPGWQQSHGANIESCVAYHSACSDLQSLPGMFSTKPSRNLSGNRLKDCLLHRKRQ